MTRKSGAFRNEGGQRGGEEARLLSGRFDRNLRTRRIVQVELPEFLICALEARVREANAELAADERCTIDHYIESELVNLITLRDLAELEIAVPGFSAAVHDWVVDMQK